MIVYGVTANVSIAQLFIAGVLPGLLLAGLFMAYTIVWSLKIRSDSAAGPRLTFFQKLYASRHLIPVVTLIAAVLGSIYTGIATATEAAALGVVGSLTIAAVQGDLNWKNFRDSLLGATRLYCMIALILAGAAFLTLAMGYIGLPRHLAEWIGGLGLSPLALILALMVFYIILGCFLDGISMVVLTMGVRPADHRARRHRPDLVRHLPRAGGGDGADHAAGRLQPVRAAGHDQEGDHLAGRQALPMFALMVAAVC
jgi:C4-dicarboxylate transporter DctM subunit